MKRPRWFGTSPINFDEVAGRKVLELARGNPTTAQSLEGSLELRRNVHAIIAALPPAVVQQLNNGVFMDIASILILQRAQGYQEARLDCGALHYEATVLPPDLHIVTDSETEEAPEE